MNFSNRAPSTMKTPLTRSVSSPSFGHSKAAEDCRRPKVSPIQAPTGRAPASWSAAGLRRFSFALLCAFILAATLPGTHAAPPEFMTYQGFLVDANGNPLAPGTPANYPIIFRIFTASSGGTRMWSEQQIVTVDNGNFSVILGEGTPVGGEGRPALSSVLAGPNNADRYMSLSVTIGATTTEMLPRLRLLPAPYAFTASSANQIVNSAGAPVLNYANSRVEVAGNFAASGVISGIGSGLTGLTAAQIPPLGASTLTGTLPDARLSANVALRAGGNAFTGNQTISGNVAIAPGAGIPLTLGSTVGDKISLFGPSGNHYGFGIQGNLLQIHADQAISDVAFGWGQSTAFNETMRIKGNGNVGIGTATPSEKLTVNGHAVVYGDLRLTGAIRPIFSDLTVAGNLLVNAAVRARGGPPGSDGVLANGFAFSGNGGDNDSGMFSSADGQLEFYANAIERVRITSAGRVGIGTTTPRVPLDVRGSVNFTLSSTQADTSIDVLDAFGHNNFGSTVNKNFSILAEQYVGAVGYVASSDRRIKTGITTNSKEKDLAAIQQLRVAEYGMKDTISHGTARRNGFIAQEVEQVIPQAVSRNSGFIPDIFALATNASYAASTKTLALSLGKPHELKIGDRLRLHLDSDRRDLTVARVLSPYEFVVEGCEQSPRKVFVYGREVDDFRTVDYDQIFTVSIGAIQELAAKVQALESGNKRIAQLEKDAAEKELKHKSEISALHRELDGLKQIVQHMAAARTTPQNGAAARNAEAVLPGHETVAAR
jgi:hypothetical protein